MKKQGEQDIGSCFEESLCGRFGDCVDGFCVCAPNWFQSNEFEFFALRELERDVFIVEDIQNSSVPPSSLPLSATACDANLPLLIVLYGLLVVFGLTTLIAHSLYVKRWSTLKRLSFLLVGVVLHITYASLRLSDFLQKDEDGLRAVQRQFGIDRPSTAIWCVAFFLTNTMDSIFLNQYVALKRERVPIRDVQRSKRIIRFITNSQKIVLIFDLISAVLLILISFMDRKYALALLRTAFCLETLRSLHSLLLVWYLLGGVIDDVRKMINSRKNFTAQRFRSRLLSALPGLKLIRNTAMVGHSCFLFLFAPAIVSEFWLQLWKYFLPVYVIIGIIATLTILKGRHFKSRKRKKITWMTSRNKTFGMNFKQLTSIGVEQDKLRDTSIIANNDQADDAKKNSLFHRESLHNIYIEESSIVNDDLRSKTSRLSEELLLNSKKPLHFSVPTVQENQLQVEASL